MPDDVEAEAQVGAEAAGSDFLVEPAVGGRDDARVDAARHVLADPADFAFLQHAQQLGLRARRELADLVEKQRAAVRFLEQAGALAHRAGERAARVAEELRFEQVVGERGAVDRAEPAVAPRPETMDRARDELLAAAALPFDQDGKRRARGAQDRLSKRTNRCAVANDVIRVLDGWRAGGGAIQDRPHVGRHCQGAGAQQRHRAVRIEPRARLPPGGKRCHDFPSIADGLRCPRRLVGHVGWRGNAARDNATSNLRFAGPGPACHRQDPAFGAGREHLHSNRPELLAQPRAYALDCRPIVRRSMTQFDQRLEIRKRTSTVRVAMLQARRAGAGQEDVGLFGRLMSVRTRTRRTDLVPEQFRHAPPAC